MMHFLLSAVVFVLITSFTREAIHYHKMEAEPLFAMSTKQNVQKTVFGKCVICQDDSVKEPFHKITETGITSLKYAVENRDDTIAQRLILDVKSDNILMSFNPKWHPKCRNKYTNKKTVEQHILRRSLVQNIDTESGITVTPSRKSSKCINFKTVCFYCEKARGPYSDRKLIKVAYDGRQEKVFQKAKELNDESMLYKIESFGNNCADLVAKDFRYHKICMTRCLNKIPKRTEKSKTLYQLAFEDLITEIHPLIYEEKKVFKISDLLERYIELSKELGLDASNYQSKRLVQRLKDYYHAHPSCNISVLIQKGSSNIICSSLLSVVDLLKAIKDIKDKNEGGEEELIDFEHSDFDVQKDSEWTNYLTAKFMRKEIKQFAKALNEKQCNNKEDGEVDMEISTREAEKRTPKPLFNFVSWLLNEQEVDIDIDGKCLIDTATKQKVLNLSQDILNSVVKVPTPKHVGIALTVLKETRSKDLVTLLNRYGNCTSYSVAQRYMDTMAVDADLQIERDGFFMPNGIAEHKFTQFAIDNLDFHEDTKDGKTLHGTTHNIYQYQSEVEEIEVNISVPLVKKRRSSSNTQYQTPDTYLSATDRKKGKSLSGINVEVSNKDRTVGHTSLLWHIVRISANDDQFDSDETFVPPTWASFNNFLVKDETPATNISYGPIFPDSPTSPAVVHSSLQYCMNVSQKIGQRHCIITCDQAIYEITLSLRKKYPDIFKNVILRMGGFHIANNFLSAIGYFTRSSGIEDLLVQAGVFLPGTVKKIMNGKDYYKMVRGHTLVYTVMFELLWESYEKWLFVEGDEELLDSLNLVKGSVIFKLNTGADLSLTETENEILKRTEQSFRDYCKNECVAPTAKYWLMYIEMVSLLRSFIHAERIGCWKLHLEETEQMLPYMVSTGHLKYVSCLPHYLHEMKMLPVVAPEVHEEFEKGNFVVRRTPGKYNGVWTDMGLEQTYNCDAKTKLFHGISQKPETMDKYLKIIPNLTKVADRTKQMIPISKPRDPSEEKKSEAEKENLNISTMKSILNGKMINPFNMQKNSDLINISTGEKAQCSDIINAKDIGLNALQRTKENDSETVKNMKVQNFEKTPKVTSKTKAVQQVYISESEVNRSLYFIQNLDNEKRIEALSHEWTMYPTSLFEPDKTSMNGYIMRKGNKADFITELKDVLHDDWPEKNEITNDGLKYTYLIDAMAFVQKNQKLGSSTFFELQKKYREKLLEVRNSDIACVNLVGDRYDFECSLKDMERNRRESAHQPSREYEIHDNLEIPEWKEFVKNRENKANLQAYIVESLVNAPVPEHTHLIVGGMAKSPETTYDIKTSQVETIPQLECKFHEEADTRIFAHLEYCVKNLMCNGAVIEATDTDIFILSMYFMNRVNGLQQLWIKRQGTYIAIHDITKYLEKRYKLNANLITGVLLTVYVITGCDTVSYLHKRDKKRALRVALENLNVLLPLSNCLQYENEEVKETCHKFLALLYGRRGFQGNADELRAHLYASFKGDLRCLPPTEDAFKQHLLRAKNQLIIYQGATDPELNKYEPDNYGRHYENGKLTPTMMIKAPKPLLKVHQGFCKCTKGKCLKNCSCAKANTACMVACFCNGRPEKCYRIKDAYDDDNDLELC